MKQCNKCEQFKELSEFVKRGSGTRNICKECYNKSKRKTEPKPIPKEGFRYCAVCKVEKPIDSFAVRMSAGKRRTHCYCKECEHKRDNSRYEHKCEKCGIEYRSGKKDSRICHKCRNKEFGAAGGARLAIINRIPQNNPWYGKPRYGTENPNYKPEKTDEEREKGRIIPGYKEWVQAVYERDGYTCQCCGDRKGGNLNAHHLDGYAWNKEKRTDVSNGVTLCDSCHKAFHTTYGFNNNTKEQFAEFQTKYQHGNTEVSQPIA